MRAGDQKHRAGRVIGRIATECSSTMYLRSHKECKVEGRQRRERGGERELTIKSVFMEVVEQSAIVTFVATPHAVQ